MVASPKPTSTTPSTRLRPAWTPPSCIASAAVSATVSLFVPTLTAVELAAADLYEVDDYRRISARLTSGNRSWVYLAT